MESAHKPKPEEIDGQSNAGRNISSLQQKVTNILGALTLGVVIGIAGVLGWLRHQSSEVKRLREYSATVSELLRERFIADYALHELSISQLLELSDEDFARIAHAQISGAYSSIAECSRTPPIEDREIEDTLDRFEEAIQRLEASIAHLNMEKTQAGADKQRELVGRLGMVRLASLRSVYAMYKMGNDRPASATDKTSQRHLSRFVKLHAEAASLFESAFAGFDVYTEPFEEHNVNMLRGRSARGAAFVNKDAKALGKLFSSEGLRADFQGLAQERLVK